MVRLRRALARTLLRLARFRVVGEAPARGIVVGAPHTSNWDWVATLLLMWSFDASPRILVKRELFRGPLGWVLRATGGVPVARDDASRVVDDLAAHLDRDEKLLVAIAAEGTRGRATHWKSGFYRLSRQTGLPVALGFIDGATRTVGFGPTVELTGDVAADMDVIRAFYADKHGLRPALRTEPRLREELETV